MSDIIMAEHAKTQALKEEAIAKEAKLESIRQLKERDERLNLRITTKFDFKRKNVTKRSNSSVPQLIEFVEMDDKDDLLRENNILNYSANGDRDQYNTYLEDAKEGRFAKIVM